MKNKYFYYFNHSHKTKKKDQNKRQQTIVSDFVSSLGFHIVADDRKILKWGEIDIYVPEKQLAIEYDGLHWHSEQMGKNRNYHVNKTTQCAQAGIQLLHVFEDEWLYKNKIVKNIIRLKLGKINRRIVARKCEVREITTRKQSSDFLRANHIHGSVKGTHIGLFDMDNKLVQIMTVLKLQPNKRYDWEILRTCFVRDTQVMGGMEKLVKYFIEKYKPKSIVSYDDYRYGDGETYLSCGFTYSHLTKPRYCYTINGQRKSNFRYRKHKLDKLLDSFDPTLNEWQNMKMNGYDRIWDCGYNVYVYKI